MADAPKPIYISLRIDTRGEFQSNADGVITDPEIIQSALKVLQYLSAQAAGGATP